MTSTPTITLAQVSEVGLILIGVGISLVTLALGIMILVRLMHIERTQRELLDGLGIAPLEGKEVEAYRQRV